MEKLTSDVRRNIYVACLIVSLIAILAICGWLFSNLFLISVVPGYPTLKFNTAICLLISAFTLFSFAKRNSRKYVAILILILGLISSLTLSQALFGFNLHIDEFIIYNRFPDAHNYSQPGRMAGATSFCFLLLSIAYFFLFLKKPVLGQSFLHIVTFIAFLSILAYIFQVPFSLRPWIFMSMSLNTSVGLIILSIGSSFIYPLTGITQYFVGEFIGSKITRFFFPSMTIICIILGLVLLRTIQKDALSLEFGISIFTASFVIIGLMLISRIAYKLNETDKKRTQEIAERRKAEKWFKSVIEASPSAMIVVDNAGTITLLNKQTELLFGYERSELMGKSVDLLIPFKIRDQHSGYRQKFAKDPTKRAMGMGRDLHCRKKDGTEIPVEIGLNPIETEDGLSVLASVIDISERKVKEGIQQRNNELVIRQKELERLNYVASHDLQEPLRTVSNYIQILHEDFGMTLDEEAKGYLNTIDRATQRMRTLVQALLEYSRLDRDIEKEIKNTQEIVEHVIKDLETLITSTKTKISFQDLPTLKIYAVEFGLLMQNLISNAIKFRNPKKDPLIDIHCINENWYWKFSIHDNGIGIDPKFFERIFVIFQRLHSAKEYAGTGIGLANCKKIVEMHGGKIWVESAPGEGSTFYFTIPKEQNEKT